MQHRKRAVALGLLLLVAAIIAVVLLRGRNDDAASPRPEGVVQQQETAAPPPGDDSAPVTISVESPPSLDMTPEKIQRVLDDYKRNAIYPHWSRPLELADTYKLKWNEAITSDLEMDDRPGQEKLYRFDADRSLAAFGEPYTSWFEVWHKGERNHRVPLKISGASVNAVSGSEQGKLLDLEYRDDGKNGDAKAGDYIYTNRFVPSSLQELRSSKQVHIQANVEAEGGATRVMTRDFGYTPRPPLEVERVTDAIVNGHLEVTLHVEVFEPGAYTIEANCMASDGETPLAYMREFYKLAAGKQKATLRFFGKIFHDKGFDGPYVIKDIRGFLRFFDSDEAPLWFYSPKSHRTAAYNRSKLDAAEWDDEEKRQRIKGYEEMLDEATRAQRGQSR